MGAINGWIRDYCTVYNKNALGSGPAGFRTQQLRTAIVLDKVTRLASPFKRRNTASRSPLSESLVPRGKECTRQSQLRQNIWFDPSLHLLSRQIGNSST